jgi:hypothetical protein
VGWLLELENHFLVLSGDPRTRLELLGMGSEVFRFLDRFDRPTLVRDVIEAMTGHKLAGAQIARALMLAVHTGYLSVTPTTNA